MFAQLCLLFDKGEQAMGVGCGAVASGYFDEGAFYTRADNVGVLFFALVAPVAGVPGTEALIPAGVLGDGHAAKAFCGLVVGQAGEQNNV